MDIMLIAGVFIFLLAVYVFSKSMQLEKFSTYLHECIDDLYSTEKWQTTEINVSKSFKNYSNSFSWNYNFKDMIVYEPRN